MCSNESILMNVQERLKIWSDIDETQIMTKFLPSMSNVVYMVQVNNENRDKISIGEPIRVLYREFAGGLVNQLIDRNVENELFQFLADLKLGPQLLYVDTVNRMEEFINASPLTPDQMVDHKCQLNLMKEITKYHILKPSTISRVTPFENFIYSMKMHELIEIKKSMTEFTSSEMEKIDIITKTFNKEFFEDLMEKVKMPEEDLVVSHNDLLNGNIMQFADGSFMLIDYEYMSYNFPGYDIANFCNECMFDYSYPHSPNFKLHRDRMPTGEHLVKLYKVYIINFDARKKGEEPKNIVSLDDTETLDLIWEENLEKNERILEKLLYLHKYNLVISHLYWLLWAIIVSRNPKINFDYIEFSWERHLEILELLA